MIRGIRIQNIRREAEMIRGTRAENLRLVLSPIYRDWESAVNFSIIFFPGRWHWGPLLNKLVSKN